LLVEDDPDVADVLGALLVRFGYDAVTARDGAHALAMLREGMRPRVVLLDLMMPNMDGYRFRRAQRADPRFAEIPTIVITAQARPDLQDLAPDAHLRKPFEMEALLAELERQLGT
jgi:CheY-like chemotaxis protein